MDNNEINKKLLAIEWQYGDRDSNAKEVLLSRIREKGKQLGLISYSELVEDVEFRLPNLLDGKPHTIRTHKWTNLDRRIVGDFLGFISKESFLEGGFFASALVVSKSDLKPSWHFFQWMEDLAVIPNLSDSKVLEFWADHVNRAHNWYRRQG